MSLSLRILLIIFSITLFITILAFVSKKKIPIKYSLFWIISSILIFFVGVFPHAIGTITSLVGFQATSNMVIGIILTLLLVLTLILTIIVSKQNKEIQLLIQELSILKEEKKWKK